MPQSFASVPIHIIFSTKNRNPLLDDGLLPSVFEYLGRTALSSECKLLIGGGVADHVHLLVSLARTISIAELVRSLKSSSSRWLHDTRPDLRDFSWQSGYAAFGVSESSVESVKAYIANQKAHHEKTSFQDEYRAFLSKHGVEFDERYVWD